jgi:hypothetical protein
VANQDSKSSDGALIHMIAIGVVAYYVLVFVVMAVRQMTGW